jgi:uncharacterized coiled-coil protein SlyX
MPNNNSKKQSIYKPTSGKRLSKKRIYKLLKKDKMNGGGILDGLSAIFGGDPEKDESKSSGVEPPSDEQLVPPSDEPPSEEPVVPPSEEPVVPPSEEPPSEEPPSEEPVETPSVETEDPLETEETVETDETPSVETEEIVETSSGSNIDGQGNIETIDNSLSVSEKKSPSLFDDALDAASIAVDSAKNTFKEISGAVTPEDGDAEDGDAGDSDAGDSDAGDSDAGDSDAGDSDAGDSDAGDGDAGDGDAGDGVTELTNIIAAQTKTINALNETINAQNLTINEQSNKLVNVFEEQINYLKRNMTNNNGIQYPPVSSPMSMGSPSVSTDAKPPMIIGTSSPTSPGNTESLPNRTGVGGKTKGRRSTKKRRSK